MIFLFRLLEQRNINLKPIIFRCLKVCIKIFFMVVQKKNILLHGLNKVDVNLIYWW